VRTTRFDKSVTSGWTQSSRPDVTFQVRGTRWGWPP
jgi:hypothetical protein